MDSFKIHSSWEKAIKGIIKDPGVCIVLGSSDSGKTSFIRYLSSFQKCLLIDSDIGQSTIGPPGTIGLAHIENGSIGAPPLKMYFVGSISPTGYMLSFLTGGRKVLDYATTLGEPLIAIDTTGLVYGGAAKELKIRKIDSLSPKHIIALEKDQELENILLPQEKRIGMKLWRIRPPEAIEVRSMEERQVCRKKSFTAYFSKKKSYSLPIKEVGAIGILPDLGGKAVSRKEFLRLRLERIKTLKNALIGLNDGNNFTLAVGLITDVDTKKETILFEAPEFDISQTRILQFSSLKLDSF